MARETQIDTHDIDKLLNDDDFIDEFDFSEDLADEFIDAESALDEELGGELEVESDLDEFIIEEPSAEGRLSGAGVVASGDELASVALEFNGLEFGTITTAAKAEGRGFKIVICLAVIFWLVQLFGVLYLTRQPVVIRDEIHPLTAEIDLSQKPLTNADIPVSDEAAAAVDSSQPEITIFTLYLPLYSLDGLKVFSAEVEVAQFQERGRLIGEGEKELQKCLRIFLQQAIGERLREEIVDVKGYLIAEITSYIENYFIERQVDLNKVKIRIHNPQIE